LVFDGMGRARLSASIRSDRWFSSRVVRDTDRVLRLTEKDNSKRGYRMTLLVPPKDPDWEMWNGARTGLDGAREIFGADEVST